MSIIQREGKIIAKKVMLEAKPEEAKEDFYLKIIEIEQELNGRIAVELQKKYGVMLRFHL